MLVRAAGHAERIRTVSIDIRALAHEACYGATKARAEFIALAKANGYEGRGGGWICRADSTDPIAQGWTAFAGRVIAGAIVLRTMDEIEATDPLRIGRGQNGKGAEAPFAALADAMKVAAELREAIPAPTAEEFRARLREMTGAPAIPARMMMRTYYLATDPQTHLMREAGSAALCGEPAQRRGPITNGDVSRVDCLVCLDRYTEEVR